MIRNTRFFYIYLALFMMVACNEPDCINVGGDQIRLNFYELGSGDALPTRINLLSVLGSDEILIEAESNVTSLILPINPVSDSITVFFDTELGNDTLIIGYNRIARFIAEDCGAETTYQNLNIIRNDFDSIRVINSSTNINFLEPDVINENIQVFN